MRIATLKSLVFVSCVLAPLSAVLGDARAWAAATDRDDAPIVLSNDGVGAGRSKLKASSVSPSSFSSTSTTSSSFSWVVQPAPLPPGLVTAGTRPPCIAIHQEGAGDQLRFSGGGHRLTGIAVVGSGLALTKLEEVPVTMTFDRAKKPIRLSGFAASENSVIVNTMKYEDLYRIVLSSSVLKILVGQGGDRAELSYRLEGVAAAFQNLESCYQDGHVRSQGSSSKTPSVDEGVADEGVADEDVFTISDALFDPADQKPSSTVPTLAPLPEKIVSPVVPVVPPRAASRQSVLTSVPGPSQNRMSVLSAKTGSDASTHRLVPSPDPAAIVDSFRARKGEGLRDVLRRWSDRAGVDLVWTIPTDIVLEDDFSYVGNFRKAIEELIRAYPKSGLNTVYAPDGLVSNGKKPFIEEANAPAVPPEPVEGAALEDFVPPMPAEDLMLDPNELADLGLDQPRPSAPSLPPISRGTMTAALPPTAPILPAGLVPQTSRAGMDASSAAQPEVGPVKRWRALQGASMREVLMAWAENTDIQLVWKAPQDFAVRRSVNVTTDYGRAVNHLLEQYMYQPVRPVGQVYRDPQTGAKVLVVQMVRR